jgi:hypothetical protein
VNLPQLLGRKSRDSEVTMITKRSNHMPTSTHTATNIRNGMLVRKRLNQNSCGVSTLQQIMIQYAHA